MRPLELLYEPDGVAARHLPARLRRLYGGDLGFARPCLYANFVSSVDGVVALGAGKTSSGPAISGRSEADRFVMGLLRAFAGAVLVGAGTVREDPGHLWRPSYIHPPSARGFARLRRDLGLAPEPLLAVVTASGDLDPQERALAEGALVFTPAATAARLESVLPSSTEVVALGGGPAVDMRRVLAELHARGHLSVLTEGGPHVLTELLRAGALEELFLTLSPVLAGRGPDALGLVEGLELLPRAGAWAELAGLRRHGSHLFLRYRLGRRGRRAHRPS